MPVKASIKRDVMLPHEKIWYRLKYGPAPLRVEKRAHYDPEREPGDRHYIEYIVTDKPLNQINWESTDET